MLILVNIIKKPWTLVKILAISILVKIYKNLEFGQNCRKKISNLVKRLKNSRFWSKLWKNVDLGQNLPKC